MNSRYLLIVLILFYSCTRYIRSYNDPRIPTDVQYAFRNYDLSGPDQESLDTSFRVIRDDETVTVKYIGTLNDAGEVLGRFEITTTSPGSAVQKKEHPARLKAIFCCTVHNPRHCAPTRAEADKLQQTHTCSSWRLVFN
jgi:hypothetical protein